MSKKYANLDPTEFVQFLQENPQVLNQLELPVDFIDAEKTKIYLRKNPNFFLENSEILPSLNFPHNCGNADSLLLYQIKKLREEIKRQDSFLSELINVAETNHSKLETIQELILKLLDSPDNPVLFTNLQGRLRHNMGIHQTKLFCYQKFVGLPFIESTNAKEQLDILGDKKARLIFLDEKSSEILNISNLLGGSAALCRLEDNSALLVLAHKDAKHFTPDQDTLFIEYLASALSRLLVKDKQVNRKIGK